MADLTEVGEWQGNYHVVAHHPSGDIDMGYFQKASGGGLDGDGTKWGSGGMSKKVARGGPAASRENRSVSRAYSPSRDGALFDQLEDYVNRVRVTGTDLVLDVDGAVLESKPEPGVLKAMGRGDYDDGSNDQRTFALELVLDD